jgi:hypothetical protein
LLLILFFVGLDDGNNGGPLSTIDMQYLMNRRIIITTPECTSSLLLFNNRLNVFKLANRNLYKHANEAKLMECSAASLTITFNLLRNDKLFPNRNVITTACGIRIFNPYFPPPNNPESMAATSSHNSDDDDDDDVVVVVVEVLCSVMGSSRPPQPSSVLLTELLLLSFIFNLLFVTYNDAHQ